MASIDSVVASYPYGVVAGASLLAAVFLMGVFYSPKRREQRRRRQRRAFFPAPVSYRRYTKRDRFFLRHSKGESLYGKW